MGRILTWSTIYLKFTLLLSEYGNQFYHSARIYSNLLAVAHEDPHKTSLTTIGQTEPRGAVFSIEKVQKWFIEHTKIDFHKNIQFWQIRKLSDEGFVEDFKREVFENYELQYRQNTNKNKT